MSASNARSLSGVGTRRPGWGFDFFFGIFRIVFGDGGPRRALALLLGHGHGLDPGWVVGRGLDVWGG